MIYNDAQKSMKMKINQNENKLKFTTYNTRAKHVRDPKRYAELKNGPTQFLYLQNFSIYTYLNIKLFDLSPSHHPRKEKQCYPRY